MSAFAALMWSTALVAPLRQAIPCHACAIERRSQLKMLQKDTDGRVLVTLSTMSASYRAQVETALEQRNRERILAGQPVYKNVEDMVASYQEYEANEKGMSREEAEDAVLTYLQKKATMEEGLFEGDPQEILTFVLLIALVGGLAYNFITAGLPSFS